MEELIRRSDAIKAIEALAIHTDERYLNDLEYGHNEGLAHAIDRIEDIPSADRPKGLIPCSERLPKIGEHHISEPCLVYCKCGAYAFAELEENIFGQVGWNCERDDDYHEPIGEVVAWMPLPEPWKGAENSKECHKPQSLYYRAFCEERKDSAYCDGCEFWY